MSIKFIALSDLHLDEASKIDLDPLKRYVSASDLDAITVLGDVVDNIPIDRINPEEIKRDIDVGRGFFEELNNADVPAYVIPGNHDYDIFDEMIEGFQNVRDATQTEYITNDTSYVFVGNDVDDFDMGSEIDYKRFGIDDLDSVGNVLQDMAEEGMSIERAMDELNLDEEFYGDFKDQAEDFEEKYDELKREFSDVGRRVNSNDQVIFLSHIAPFGTKLDRKTIGHETQEHGGSIASRKIIDLFSPGLAVNGHHDYFSMEYIETDDYKSSTYAVGIEEANPTEITLYEDGDIEVEQLG